MLEIRTALREFLHVRGGGREIQPRQSQTLFQFGRARVQVGDCRLVPLLRRGPLAPRESKCLFEPGSFFDLVCDLRFEIAPPLGKLFLGRAQFVSCACTGCRASGFGVGEAALEREARRRRIGDEGRELRLSA